MRMLFRLLQARALPVAVTIAALLVPSLASAQVCEEASETQVALHYLRKLSLDLRGALPTLEESQAVIDAGGLDDSVIDAMLASDGFLHQVRQYHRDLELVVRNKFQIKLLQDTTPNQVTLSLLVG